MGDELFKIFDLFVERLRNEGEEPTRADFLEVREHLRVLLVGEMKKRGLWSAPPTYLGIQASSWSDREALEELVGDAYTYVFADRLAALIKQSMDRSTLAPLIRMNVNHFVTDRQRLADPLGYRIFGRLKSATLKALKRGKLFLHGEPITSDPPKIHNQSELTFRRGWFEAIKFQLLEMPVRLWNDFLLPDLILAEGRSVPAVIDRLLDLLLALPKDGIEAFLFGDLCRVQKEDARRRWEALWRDGFDIAYSHDGKDDEPVPELAVAGHEETEAQWMERRELILEEVGQAIDDLEGVKAKEKEDLWKLWIYLRSTRLFSPEMREGNGTKTTPDPDIPNDSKLGKLIGVSRKNIPKRIQTLRMLVETAIQEAGSPDRSTLDSSKLTRSVNGTQVPGLAESSPQNFPKPEPDLLQDEEGM